MAKKVYPGQVVNVYAKSGGSATASRGRKTVKATRSKENKGHPLGLVALDQKRAPWMQYAVAEAKRWKGSTEDKIDDTINYHKAIGVNDFPSMVGTQNAWCASFVNWCLRQAGYAMSTVPFRARSFIGDKSFTELKTPIYGAISVVGTHHACFVYAQDEKTGGVIVLGGNQHDQINFAVKGGLRYFVPKAYEEFAQKEVKNSPLMKSTAQELNDALGIQVDEKKGGGDGTR